jgi:transcriptional regulator with XRE-family HTH domain
MRDGNRLIVGAITVTLPEGVLEDAELLAIGRRIARARAAARLTQQDLAERLGVTRRSVQGYEAGKVAPYRHLDRLAAVLDRPKTWFLLDRRDLGRIVRDEVSGMLADVAYERQQNALQDSIVGTDRTCRVH